MFAVVNVDNDTQNINDEAAPYEYPSLCKANALHTKGYSKYITFESQCFNDHEQRSCCCNNTTTITQISDNNDNTSEIHFFEECFRSFLFMRGCISGSLFLMMMLLLVPCYCVPSTVNFNYDITNFRRRRHRCSLFLPTYQKIKGGLNQVLIVDCTRDASRIPVLYTLDGIQPRKKKEKLRENSTQVHVAADRRYILL